MNPETLTPDAAARVVPALGTSRNPNVWVYRYHDEANGWTLSAATHAPPGSDQLSLGGFRIAPPERMNLPGFTTDHEAISLAMGMEEKVHWSRVIGVGGPLVLRDIKRIVGGKCVLAPTPDARVGQPRDTELLDFAIACFQDLESRAGIHLTTGQDMGHGLMHDGRTASLAYLNQRFKGSVVADTSRPTGEGNYQLLRGMLRAFDVQLSHAVVGLIGCGHVGMHVVQRLLGSDTTMIAMEPSEERRADLETCGVRTWSPDAKAEFLTQPMDALVVNAAGGTLDGPAVDACCRNARLKVICGSENLAMPDASLSLTLRDAHKAFASTEMGGMMGYLTAAEEYLSRLDDVPFDVDTLMHAAVRLNEAGHEATSRLRRLEFRETFDEAVTAIYTR